MNWNTIFDTSMYETSNQKQMAVFSYGIIVTLLVIYTIFSFFIAGWTINVDAPDYVLVEAFNLSNRAPIYLIPFYSLIIFSFVMLRRGQLETATSALLGAWFVNGILITLLGAADFTSQENILSLMIFSLFSSLLKREIGSVIGVIVSLSMIFIDYDPEGASSQAIIALQFIGIGVLTYLFNVTLRSNRLGIISATAEERIKLASINTQITRKASQRASLQEILDLAPQLIVDAYDNVYHVGVFLIDKNNLQANLVASLGEPGKKLIAQKHSLAVGSLSVIGQTTLRGEVVIERADDTDSMHRFNELLPDTQVEAAFPLRVGDDIIGALDLQSRDRIAFNDIDISTFQSLADSLSLIIDNVRQYENTRDQIVENQRLAEQSQKALSEIQRLNKRLIGRAWSEYLRAQVSTTGLNLNIEDDSIEEDTRWTTTLAEATQLDDIVQTNNVVAVPLHVRGQVIGAMEFEVDNTNDLSANDLELLREISDRFGLAAENTRLVDESQRSAQRESLINEISSRLQANNTVESTLTEAARSLSETLRAQRVAIRIGSPEMLNTTANVTTSEDD